MRIHHVQIMIAAGREDEARGYYQEILRLTPIPRPRQASARPGLWFRCAGQEVHLGVEARPVEAGSRAHVAFQVADLDALRARLEGADFEVREAPPLAGARRFHTRDPFGNRLEFLEEARDA
jgi:catechol 2,3-dioxygenase-like lactoylglutathione lyase family enzyme